MYDIITWNGRPETAERILKVVGNKGWLRDNGRLYIEDHLLMPMLEGERIVATADVWWKESVRYPRRVEPVSTSPEYVEKNAESVQVAGGAS